MLWCWYGCDDGLKFRVVQEFVIVKIVFYAVLLGKGFYSPLGSCTKGD